jgi:hypothetical protein
MLERSQAACVAIPTSSVADQGGGRHLARRGYWASRPQAGVPFGRLLANGRLFLLAAVQSRGSGRGRPPESAARPGAAAVLRRLLPRRPDVAAEHIDVHLPWGEPPTQVAEKTAARGLIVRFGGCAPGTATLRPGSEVSVNLWAASGSCAAVPAPRSSAATPTRQCAHLQKLAKSSPVFHLRDEASEYIPKVFDNSVQPFRTPPSPSS